MKVLITQRELMSVGGSELFTVDVARALSARGHAVAVFCPRPGNLTKLITPSGVSVRSKLAELPWTPDVIHGQHHLPAMAAFAHFPKAPGLYCWHGARPWVEQAPPHPRIHRYVVTSDWMAPQVRAELDIARERIVTIPNFVDVRRFSTVRTPPATPRRAVLFGHGGFSLDELARLEHACAANGLSLDKIGHPYGNARPTPEVFLPEYDVVFAIGRCAIEALACACAVIPIVPGLAGRMVTDETLGDWAYSNFSPRHYTSAEQIDDAWLGRELGAWSPDMLARTSAAIRRSHSLDSAIDRFEALYDEAAGARSRARNAAEFAPYLERLSHSADAMWADLEGQRAQVRQADLARDRALEANQRLQDEVKANALKIRTLLELIVSVRAGDGADAGARDDDAAALIRASEWFDADWYLTTYPDVAQSGIDPAIHYIVSGAAEGRAPSPTFNPRDYMDANPWLAGSGVNPLEHFLRQLAAVSEAAPKPAAPKAVEAPATPESRRGAVMSIVSRLIAGRRRRVATPT